MYVSKHKHKDDSGAFGNVLKRLGNVRMRLERFGSVWGRLAGKLVSIIPYSMVCYGM